MSCYKTSSFVLMMIFVISLSNFNLSSAARLFLDRQADAETSTDRVSDFVRDRIHKLLHPMSSSSTEDIDQIMYSDMPANIFPTTFSDFPTDHDGLSSHLLAWKEKVMERIHHKKQESVTPNAQPEETSSLSSMEIEQSNPTTPTSPALTEPVVPAAASVTTATPTSTLPETAVPEATTRANPGMPATIPYGSIPMQQAAQVYQPVHVVPVYNPLPMAAFPTGTMPALAYAAGASAMSSATMQAVP